MERCLVGPRQAIGPLILHIPSVDIQPPPGRLRQVIVDTRCLSMGYAPRLAINFIARVCGLFPGPGQVEDAEICAIGIFPPKDGLDQHAPPGPYIVEIKDGHKVPPLWVDCGALLRPGAWIAPRSRGIGLGAGLSRLGWSRGWRLPLSV